jgi:K+-transporting ATPase KdpF subunit
MRRTVPTFDTVGVYITSLHLLYARRRDLCALFAPVCVRSILCRTAGETRDRSRFHRRHRRLLRRIGRPRRVLRAAVVERKAAMTWIYWMSGAAALVIFVYLIVALFKPERFE